MPPALADTSLASTHPDWVKEANGGLYLDPSRQDVMDYICAGVEEVLRGYDCLLYTSLAGQIGLARLQAIGKCRICQKCPCRTAEITETLRQNPRCV